MIDDDMDPKPNFPASLDALDEPLPLFAYGSLADGELVVRLLEREVPRGPATFQGHKIVPLPGLDYPSLVPAGDDEAARGVLFRGLTEDDFRRLDAYQGVGEGLYQRVRVEVTADGTDEPEPAWVYVATARTLRRFGRS